MRPIFALFTCLLLLIVADCAIAGESHLFWTTGDGLLPAWGFLPERFVLRRHGALGKGYRMDVRWRRERI